MRYYLENSRGYTKELVSGKKTVFSTSNEFIAMHKTFHFYLGKLKSNADKLQSAIKNAQNYADDPQCKVEYSQEYIDDLHTMINNVTKNISLILEYIDMVQKAVDELDKANELLQKHLNGEDETTESEE
jgi:peptidoglycan hydrolase CwlO-like protein